jgi:hypothetical protein
MHDEFISGAVPGRMSNREGGSHVVDDCYNTHDSMAAGVGDRLYDGLFYSYPAGRCHHRHTDPSYSGTKMIIAIWTLAGEGEVLGKGMGSKGGKIFPNLTIPSVEKILQPTISTSSELKGKRDELESSRG